MCGLILAPKEYAFRAVERAMDRMGYRGLNNQRGLSTWGDWRLGHVRLPIQYQDQGGMQPFSSGDALTAFVGEFLNHRGEGEFSFLNKMLRSNDLWSFHQADGFWSVVSIRHRGDAWVLTDHLGIKPLYWWPQHGIVCSEIEPMFELEPRPGVDKVYLSNCIKFGYDYSGRTPWKGIHQLPPGKLLKLPQQEVLPYWDWSLVPGRPGDLRNLLDLAIHNRLISDREVSLLLSGGLDSSIIYYSLQSQGFSVRSFSIENGESEFLPAEVQLLPEQAPASLEEAAKIMQAPLDLGSLLPQIRLSRALRDSGAYVCLSGDGADELFGGYSRAQDYDSQASDIFCELPYYHLPRLDRVMMRETIELRSPYLAPSVIAAALRTPRELRTSKQSLKEAYKGLVPEAILNRKKHPLKSQEVLQGGLQYRQRLLEAFLHAHNAKYDTPSF